MIKLTYSKEKNTIRTMHDVQNIVLGILKVLDSEYGKKRKNNINCDDIIPEYMDKIICSSGEVNTNSLILCSNEFGISLIISMELTPQNLKDYIID